MSRFIVAMLGARMHYAVPRILHDAGRLECFFTDFCASAGWPRLLATVPKSMRPPEFSRILSRLPAGVPADRIHAFNLLGLDYARHRKYAKTLSDMTGVFLEFNERFCERITQCDWRDAGSVFTFNCAGLEVLQLAKMRSLEAFSEQTIAPYTIEKSLLATERASHEGWEHEIEDSYAERYEQREQAEWKVADKILCGSDFVRDSIQEAGGPVEKCIVVPYGVDFANRQGVRSAPTNRPLRVLTVGAVGLRKGAPYVLGAARMLQGRVEFRWVGGVDVLPVARDAMRPHVELIGPVPRDRIDEHYAWADVFLLPSVCEGSATVTYEALARGLPVICTPNTGSVVRDGTDGFIVPVRDCYAIVDGLVQLSQNPELYVEMSRSAVRRAADFTVAAYGRRLLQSLCSER